MNIPTSEQTSKQQGMTLKRYLKRIVLSNTLIKNSMTPVWHLYRRLTRGYATVHGLRGRIHYNDIVHDGDKDHYKSVSLQSLALIDKALKLSGVTAEEVESCLLFPCGYGRELRSIATRIHPWRITCSDINKRAVDFCKSEFGTHSFLSCDDFTTIEFPQKYSVIWCGSLFSHLPKERFGSLFTLLSSALEPGGILVFTTHEEESFNRLDDYESIQTCPKESLIERWKKEGFVFNAYPWTNQYGISISSEKYIKNLNDSLEHPMERIFYQSKGWDNHQSVYAYRQKARE